MHIGLLKKCIIWIVFVTIAVALIPFAIVFRRQPKPKNENPDTVNVYFHETGEVKQMKLEEYIIGVVTAEMPASFHEEALKAQAVATRSYTISKINANKNADLTDAHKNGDICTDFAHCQAYTSKKEALKNWGVNAKDYYKKIETAVYETQGKVITYGGDVINAVFHASNGGKTENSKDVWGGDFPYLVSVDSFGESYAPKYKSTFTVSVDDFKAKLKSEYPDIVFDNLIGESTYTSGGSVAQIQLGNKSIKGTQVRRLFNLYSANFKACQIGDKIVFDVCGHGHGVGMSQYGANYMASTGKKYDEILANYYTGTKITEYKNP